MALRRDRLSVGRNEVQIGTFFGPGLCLAAQGPNLASMPWPGTSDERQHKTNNLPLLYAATDDRLLPDTQTGMSVVRLITLGFYYVFCQELWKGVRGGGGIFPRGAIEGVCVCVCVCVCASPPEKHLLSKKRGFGMLSPVKEWIF